MQATQYEALLAASIPRDPQVIRPYVRRATKWMRQMIYIFAGMSISVALIGGTIDFAGGHADHLWQSYAKGFAYVLLPSLFFLGPVVLFWSVNRGRLLRLGKDGRILPATVAVRETMNMRGNEVAMATIAFMDESGRSYAAKFQGPPAATLKLGDQVHVLQHVGDTVAVVWGPDALVLARVSRSTRP